MKEIRLLKYYFKEVGLILVKFESHACGKYYDIKIV